MSKRWFSYDDQLALLRDRGLIIENPKNAIGFLRRVSYYRMSGYFRYWQKDPANGENSFVPGASFSEIQQLYKDEERLIAACTDLLRPVEILLRTSFAYEYGQHVQACGGVTDGTGFTSRARSSCNAHGGCVSGRHVGMT